MNTPPVIRPARQSTPGLAGPWAFGGFLALLVVARLSLLWNLPLPFCALKRLTGIPCPFCGATRCLQAWSRCDFASAARWNPMVFLVCAGIVLWFVIWTADHLFNRHWLATVRRRLRTRTFALALVIAVLINWIYLCLTLP